MKRLGLFGVVALSLLFAPADAQAQASIQTLRTNGPLAKRLNIVFLSEGYTTGQLAQFPADAIRVLTNLLATLPLREYSNYFNAFAISVPSNESGSDHPSRSIVRDTYFNSTYDTAGLARLISIDGTGHSRVNSLLAAYMPQYDIVALIVNDTEYGGSGGFPLLTSVNSASPEIAIHELGHSFADLGDEYSTAYPGYPDIEEPNTTMQTNRALIKWNSWILPSTLVPTPDVSSNNAVVGLFQGAHYHTTGWYRPKRNCKMRTLNVAFCEVCSETLVKSIYDQIRPIEANSPATNSVIILTNAASVSLSVSNIAPSTHMLNVQWFTNNIAVAGATSAVFSVTGFALPAGTNLVRVEVTDTTAFVRNDPSQVLKDTRTWRVGSVLSAPRLTAVPGVGQITISWTTNASGFVLEATPAIAPPSWTPLLTLGSETGISLPATNPHTFFRLRRP